MPTRLVLPLVLLGSGGAACAAVPAVVTDIPPVQSIVAAVMAGVGEPAVVIGGGADPHHAALRPSEARLLEGADIVVWVGPGLSPAFGRAVAALAPDARVIALTGLPGTELLPVRLTPLFAEAAALDDHDHEAEGEAAAEHGHEAGGDEEAAEHGHDAGTADQDHADADHAEHAAGPDAASGSELDPHVWLDPENAQVWAAEIAAILGAADPDHAAAYAANAAAFAETIDALDAEVEAVLAPVRGRPFVVFHDAYQYFEHRFDFPATAAIALSDASDPGPARIEAIRAGVEATGATCAVAEPQFNQGLIRTVFEGAPVRIVTVDHLGGELPEGPGQYAAMIRRLARSLADCVS